MGSGPVAKSQTVEREPAVPEPDPTPHFEPGFCVSPPGLVFGVRRSPVGHDRIVGSAHRSGHAAEAATGTPLSRLRRVTVPHGVLRRTLDDRILADDAKAETAEGDIAAAVIAYNTGLDIKPGKQRLTELHAIEHSAYAWFRTQTVPNFESLPIALSMKRLLTSIQEENENLVRPAVQDLSIDPPVANFDALGQPEQDQVRKIWSDLVSGEGNIQITEMQTVANREPIPHAGFRIQVLTSFARLLSADFGRKLVAEINRSTDGKNLVTIKPGLTQERDGVGAAELLAAPQSSEGADLIELPAEQLKLDQHGRDELYPLLDLGATEASRMQAMHQLRPVPLREGVSTQGISALVDGERVYYRFGSGSGSSVTYPSDLRDGSNDPMSRYVDDAWNEVIVPVFIALGHELGHALHSLQGASSAQAQSLLPVAGAGFKPGDYSNLLEEIVTIRGVENMLRAEHGITGRHSHYNVVALACNAIANGPVLDKAWKDAKRLPQNLQEPVLDLLKKVDAVANARRDVGDLQVQLNAALEGLRHAEQRLAQEQETAQKSAQKSADKKSGFDCVLQ